MMGRIKAIRLPQAITQIDDLWVGDGGNRMTGTVVIFGIHYHADFLRVTGELGQQTGAGDESAEVFDRLMSFDDEGDFQTFRIPGFEGRWVVVITPFKA